MFKTAIVLNGPTTPQNFEAQLSELVAPPFSWNKSERRKPLRGNFTANAGEVRWPLNEYRFVSFRNLHFTYRPTEEGTVLEGQFVLWLWYRIIVLVWLLCGVVFQMEQLIVPGLLYHAGLSFILHRLLFTAIGVAMAYGYTWFVIRVGRRREQHLSKVLRNVLAGQVQADVVKDILMR